PLRAEVLKGLVALYGIVPVGSTIAFNFATAKPPVDIAGLIRGPDRDPVPYVLDRQGKAVYRVDPRTKKATVVLRAGQAAAGTTVGVPRLMAVGGTRDLLVLDSRNTLWRWRAADSRGRGTLGRVRVNGAAGGAFVAYPRAGGSLVAQYRLANGDPSWGNLRGFYVVPGPASAPTTIVWVDGLRVGVSPLVAVDEPIPGAASPSPSASPAV